MKSVLVILILTVVNCRDLRTSADSDGLGAPTNVKLRRLNPTALEATWDPPTYHGISGYRIYYNNYFVVDMDRWQSIEIGPYTVAEIVGLEPHAAYGVRVRAKALDGKFGNFSEIAVLNDIGEVDKDKVQEFQARIQNPRSVLLEWKPPRKPGVMRYRIDYEGIKRTSESYGGDEMTVDVKRNRYVASTERQLYIDNLSPDTRYVFNISARFIDGWGYPYSIVTETSTNGKGLQVSIKPRTRLMTVPVGGSAEILCEVNQPAAKVGWFDVHGEEIRFRSGRVHVEGGTGSSTLYITDVTSYDAGTYTCIATLGEAAGRSTIQLVLYEGIKFVHAPKLQNPVIYSDATIACVVSGDPKPQVSWRFKGKPIKMGGRYSQGSFGLTISRVTLDDEGSYTCRAEVMETGSYGERVIQVKVQNSSNFGNILQQMLQ